jgi:hypothetical protein
MRFYACVVYLAVGLVVTGLNYGASLSSQGRCRAADVLFLPAPGVASAGIVTDTLFWPAVLIATVRSGCK